MKWIFIIKREGVKKKNCKGRQWEVRRRKWRRIVYNMFPFSAVFKHIKWCYVDFVSYVNIPYKIIMSKNMGCTQVLTTVIRKSDKSTPHWTQYYRMCATYNSPDLNSDKRFLSKIIILHLVRVLCHVFVVG